MKKTASITDGKYTHSEDVTEICDETTSSFYRMHDLPYDHWLYGWWEGMCQSDYAPVWLWDADEEDLTVKLQIGSNIEIKIT